MKVALIKPPLINHSSRGTGIYTRYLFKYLSKKKEADIQQIEYDQEKKRFDIVHYPYFDPFFLTLPIINAKPTVVTIHDLIPLVYPQDFPKGIKGLLKWNIQKHAIKNVDQIITDSYASKEDIISILKFPEKQVNVIYLGVGNEFKKIEDVKVLEKTQGKYNLPKDFIVYVGDINPNKNIPRFLQAFSQIVKTNKKIHLVLVGQGFTAPSSLLFNINAYIHTLNIEKNIIKVGRVRSQDLVHLYNLAKACILPSLAEGFGLPVLEAAACGCPTVVSDVSSLKEIRPSKSIPINPQNNDSIEVGIQKVLSLDQKGRRDVIENGLTHVKQFTWEKCALETLGVYKKLMIND